jgi:3-deoxy-manno-octulosonate cytidylyltransferase (CMP-KDO synthetase)
MKRPKILCVIPARIGSTRLARKALIDINGKPMVQRTYEQALKCPEIARVVVATDSEEIAAVVKKCGGDNAIVMTSAAIKTGSDRVAVVAQHYPDMDVVINLQGDEPFVQPAMLSALVKPYLDGENPDMTTIAYPFLNFEAEFNDSGVVKVLFDQQGYALYFSRAPIPYVRHKEAALQDMPLLHHMGVYAFRRNFLLQYTKMSQTPLEIAESLEQLRALEHGYKIRVCRVEGRTQEINTEEDLKAATAYE